MQSCDAICQQKANTMPQHYYGWSDNSMQIMLLFASKKKKKKKKKRNVRSVSYVMNYGFVGGIMQMLLLFASQKE